MYQENNKDLRTTRVMIHCACTGYNVCLSAITIYPAKWANAVARASQGEDVIFNIGTDGYEEFERAKKNAQLKAQ